MLDFLAHLWPWLAACLALGAATGGLAGVAAPRKRPARWLLWAGAAFFAGAVALSLGAVEGAVSAAIESAMACFAAFMTGAAIVGALRGALGAHERWALGLLPAALVWWGAVQIAGPAYEAEVMSRVAALSQAAGADPAGLAVSGRDVTVPPAVAGNGELLARVAAAPGVRRVIVAQAPPQLPSQAALPAPAPSQPDPTATIPSPPPAAPLAGDPGAASCQRALDAVAVAEPVAFRPARAIIDRRAALALDKAVEVIRQCPAGVIEVRGHADAGAADNALARRRALAAERYLRREGVAGRKLVATGCCAGAQAARRGAGAVDYLLR